MNSRRAFTLVELLVVIAIIGILASMLLTSIAKARVAAQVGQSKLDIAKIEKAILEYESCYSRFPVSSEAVAAAIKNGGDFTFGTFGTATIKTPAGLPAVVDNPGDYHANNSEIMAVLLDLEKFGNGVDTINRGHVKNPQRSVLLNAKFSGDTSSPGIGLDGVFRDPWGNPYIITLDLNNDNKARDAFYDTPNVSEDPTSTTSPKSGINGLVPTQKNGTSLFEANTTAIVWSAGPDKKIDPNMSNAIGGKANQGANRDNVLSWK